MQARDVDYRCDEANLRGYLAMTRMLPGRGRACWCFTKGLGWANSLWSARAGWPGSAMSRSPPTCSASGGRRPICRKSLPWSAGFAPSRKNSAPAAVPRWRRWPRCRRSMPADWRRSGSASAVRWCWSSRATGADLKAVVSFHGVLATKMPAQPGQVKASVLVCTGADDPLAPPEQVAAFENEMRAGGGGGLAGDRLWQHAAWFHQPGRRRLDDAHRAVQRTGRPPLLGVDARACSMKS